MVPSVLVSASKHQIFTLFLRYNLDTLRPFTVSPSNCCHTHRFIILMEGSKGQATFSADLESSLLCPCFPLPLLALSFSSFSHRSQLLSCLEECFSSSTQVLAPADSPAPRVLCSTPAGFSRQTNIMPSPRGLLVNSTFSISLTRNNLANLGNRHFIIN